MRAPALAPAALSAVDAAGALTEARERTLALVASVSDEDLERVHSPLMSPLVWDLGHIAAFEDLWLAHRFGGKRLLRGELLDVYDAFETPRAGRGELPFLRPAAAREYLDEVRARTLETISTGDIGDGVLHELVIRHEHQHNETMLQTLQLARLEDYLPPVLTAAAPTARSPVSGLELIEIPAGACTVGAPAHGFAYDNERPRHHTDVRGFMVGRAPIGNATYLHFVEGGGYERREWWSDEGWSWKEEYDITHPGGWTADLAAEWRLGALEPLDPDRPVVHISWFEADAFARAHGARLPTEIEWEKAATWDQEMQMARPYPWGEDPPEAGVHANLDLLSAGPAPASAHPAGSSPYGCLAMIGDVWEWTSSLFDGYLGFAAHPYREYSEVFFGHEYRVLRGGSWASRARVATPTFRNWDLPQRRQIFSGLRIARDM
ncbi:MAG TPA: ergothioneine biosynthesis protein EgtB [Solirubrobacteraceae bacterium]|jgi:iron(II)-dependent oxidoreductase|nr:ergothioneine biosynthesis protein EgtB [Solirubrobacteraceae bacterium]